MSWSGLPEAIENYVMPEPMSGCWIWLASLRSEVSGYGNYTYKNKQYLAHRLIYQLLKGPIPEGKMLDHSCRVRCCVNPSHLEPVTCQENILRGEGHAAVNARKTHCAKGHLFTFANLVNLATGERCCRACTNDRAAARARAYRSEHREEDNAKKKEWSRAKRARLRAERQ